MVQINFMIDVEFVMRCVHDSIRDKLQTIVYHGLRLTDHQENVSSIVKDDEEPSLFRCWVVDGILWAHNMMQDVISLNNLRSTYV